MIATDDVDLELEECLRFLGVIFAPDDWICIDPIGAHGARSWTTLADEDDIRRELRKVRHLNARPRKNRDGVGEHIPGFYGLNPRRAHGVTGGSGVGHANAYAADFDGATPGHALDTIRRAGMPAPTALIWTGNGCHTYWRLHEPEYDLAEWSLRQQWIARGLLGEVPAVVVPDPEPTGDKATDDAASKLARKQRKAFAAGIGAADPVVHDRQRLLRLPMGLNGKPEYLTDGGARVVRLIELHPDRRFSWRDLQPKCDAPEAEAVHQRRERPEGTTLPGDDFNGPSGPDWLDVLPAGWVQLKSGGSVSADYSMRGPGGKKTGSVYFSSGRLIVFDSGSATLPPRKGGYTKFEALAAVRFGGDFKAAARHLYDEGWGSTDEAGKRDDGREVGRVEIVEAAPGGILAIDEMRQRLQAAVEDVRGTTGVKLLRGPTGCGKSFAAKATAGDYATTTTSCPTHKLAAEMAADLQAVGVNAVAWPPLDETTCGRLDVAEAALASGLSVGAAVCPDCPLKDDCTYRALVAEAAVASHKVCTHARLKKQPGVARDVGRLVIEEDAGGALVTRHSFGPADLEDVITTASAVWVKRGKREEAVEEYPEFAAHGLTAVTPVIPPVTTEQWIEESRAAMPKHGRAVLFALAARCQGILEQVRGVDAAGLVGYFPIADPLATKFIPANVTRPELSLWRLLAYEKATLPPAVVAWAFGDPPADGDLGIVAEDLPAKLGKVRRWLSVTAVIRHTFAPSGPTLVLDATTGVAELAGWSGGGEIEDVTPAGQLADHHRAAQVLLDFYQPASGEAGEARIRAAAELLAATIEARPELQRVGFITIKKYHDRLLGEDGILSPEIQRRVVWATYFGAGDDRGSNDLIGTADRLIVLGTPCPPPREVRAALVALGRHEAAGRDGGWGDVRVGAGGEEPWIGRGYADPDWAWAAKGLTRAAIRQAIGRARHTLPEGMEVTVVTREPLGLPIEEAAVVPTDGARVVAGVVEAVEAAGRGGTPGEVAGVVGNVSLSGEGRVVGIVSSSAMRTRLLREVIVGNVSSSGAKPPILPTVTAGVIAAQLRESGVDATPRTIRRWLADAVRCGLLERLGDGRTATYRTPFPRLAPGAEAPSTAVSADGSRARCLIPGRREGEELVVELVALPGTMAAPRAGDDAG